jgi:DNA helicase IV
MKIGECVRHVSRSDVGIGRIQHIYEDCHCDVAFDGCSFSWVPLSEFESIEREVRLRMLNELLALWDFQSAEAHYRLHCVADMDEGAFQSLLDKAMEAERIRRRAEEEERITAERGALRTTVETHLAVGRFDEAEALYRSTCSDWWPVSEYSKAREQAFFVQEFADGYASASLSRLDSLRESTPLAQTLVAHEYAGLKQAKLELRLARLGIRLNAEQFAACASPHRHRLITARAGSGKTLTLATLAALVINDERLNPDQVLMLAFNTKAANEIGDRVRDAAGVTEYRNARTFHSLAWKLADHAERQLVFDDGNLAPSRRLQSQFAERTIKSIMNPAFQEKLYEFFRREIEQLDRLGINLEPKEYLVFRRAVDDFTLGGENVKSNGEKFIADFLFEHDLSYVYEKVYSWGSEDRLQGSPYRPDFCLSVGGRDLILEHWAIDPDDSGSEVPPWWKNTSTRAYRDQIVAKRKFWQERGVTLLETHTGMLRDGREAFESSLFELLGKAGVRCQPLDRDTLIRRVADAPRTVSRMAGLFLAFIARAKKRAWSVEKLSKVIREKPDPEPRNRVFHELAVRAYAEYERLLEERSAMDFDDLLIAATKQVQRDGANARIGLDQKDSIAVRDLRWIMIDEFQDFSELYYQLINALLTVNPEIRIVAVGDDWQAINGFAGAQLSFFNAFARHFPAAGAVEISTNRRSGRAIVAAGNTIMDGCGQPALAHHDWNGTIEVCAIDRVRVGNSAADVLYADAARSIYRNGQQGTDWDLAKALKASAEFIVGAAYRNDEGHWLPKTLILTRTGYAYGLTLSEFESRLRGILKEHPDLHDIDNAIDLEVMTAHRAKGKEAASVIVLEATIRQFPKVHSDNQLYGPFGVSVQDTLAEERRLFYVAITRAEHRLLLLTETGQESPYLDALRLGRGADYLAGLAKHARPVPNPISDLALAIQQCLDRLDRMDLVRNNITPAAVPLLERLTGQGLPQPEIGYFLDDLCAELAWPEQVPAVAVLTGRHTVSADIWREHGWEIHIT